MEHAKYSGMLPRKRLDISAKTLAYGYGATFRRFDRAQLEERISHGFGAPDSAVVALSVRTAFDALLAVLSWPPGTEVIVSGITIPHMPEILRAHGLVVAPVDIDPHTLEVDMNAVQAAVTPKTKAVLVAHLFGSRGDVRPLCAFARQHGLRVFEDAAQAFTGDDWTGHSEADVSFFSFGTAKTATALGGSVSVVRDSKLRRRLKLRLRNYDRRETRVYRQRVVRYAALNALSHPTTYGALLRLIQASGRNPDATIMALSRGFSGPSFFDLIRKQPCDAALAVLAERLERRCPEAVQRRASTARLFQKLLPDVVIPGRRAPNHSYWLFTVSVKRPSFLRDALWAHGYDATCAASSLVAVQGADGAPAEASRLMKGLVYIPVPSGLALMRLSSYADLVRGAVSQSRHLQSRRIPALATGVA